MKKSTIAKAVAEGMPGWRVVGTRRASPVADATRSLLKADFVSPDLAVQRAKIERGAKRTAAKKAPGAAKSRKHAAFVTVAPMGMPDSVQKFHKVVLVKGGKIIAQQG